MLILIEVVGRSGPGGERWLGEKDANEFIISSGGRTSERLNSTEERTSERELPLLLGVFFATGFFVDGPSRGSTIVRDDSPGRGEVIS